MKQLDIFSTRGLTIADDKIILKTAVREVGMTIDEQGRVHNESGIYIADAVIVGPGEGIGCVL